MACKFLWKKQQKSQRPRLLTPPEKMKQKLDTKSSKPPYECFIDAIRLPTCGDHAKGKSGIALQLQQSQSEAHALKMHLLGRGDSVVDTEPTFLNCVANDYLSEGVGYIEVSALPN